MKWSHDHIQLSYPHFWRELRRSFLPTATSIPFWWRRKYLLIFSKSYHRLCVHVYNFSPSRVADERQIEIEADWPTGIPGNFRCEFLILPSSSYLVARLLVIKAKHKWCGQRNYRQHKIVLKIIQNCSQNARNVISETQKF